MNAFTGSVLFIVIWWLTFFAVLPWGVRREENPDAGHDVGAPANPRMLMKFLVTTGIAGVIWAGVYWMIGLGIIDFRAS